MEIFMETNYKLSITVANRDLTIGLKPAHFGAFFVWYDDNKADFSGVKLKKSHWRDFELICVDSATERAMTNRVIEILSKITTGKYPKL